MLIANLKLLSQNYSNNINTSYLCLLIANLKLISQNYMFPKVGGLPLLIANFSVLSHNIVLFTSLGEGCPCSLPI